MERRKKEKNQKIENSKLYYRVNLYYIYCYFNLNEADNKKRKEKG